MPGGSLARRLGGQGWAARGSTRSGARLLGLRLDARVDRHQHERAVRALGRGAPHVLERLVARRVDERQPRHAAHGPRQWQQRRADALRDEADLTRGDVGAQQPVDL